MGKCFDEFTEIVGDMKKKLENGELKGEGVECMYLSLCAGYLAYISDKLDEITSKMEENVETMRKYQKIEDIYYHQSGEALENSLRAVIEDGKID